MIEQLILANLVTNEEYMRKVLPFLKEEYFHDNVEKTLFSLIHSYITQYNGRPTKEAIDIEMGELSELNEDMYRGLSEYIPTLYTTDKQDLEWITTKTEEFCQDKAIYNAVRDSIKILDGGDVKQDRGAIPTLLSDALGVTFDANVGHDFLEGEDARYDFYHRKEEKIPFGLEYFDAITKGGLSRKSESIVLGGTGGGKTLVMCHFAASALMQGYNGVYITAEMAEERIAERIDANLLDMRVDDVSKLSLDVYRKKIQRLRRMTNGRLIIKEYPTGAANANHFRFLLRELKLKKNFTPDFVIVDYINICASSRIKMGANVNSYTYIKSIAEELRGLAIEFNIALLSATQTNRTGFKSSDPGLEDTSESFGLPATADFMFAIVNSEELESLDQIMIKQLKNRWGDINSPKRFVQGIKKEKMKLYDLEPSAQEGIMSVDGSKRVDVDDVPVMDKTSFGKGLSRERKDWT